MDWRPNVDAGIESGPYEIYGRFPDGTYSLLLRGERIGRYRTVEGAMMVAEADAEARRN